MISVCISDFAVSNKFFVSGKGEEIENHLASVLIPKLALYVFCMLIVTLKH